MPCSRVEKMRKITCLVDIKNLFPYDTLQLANSVFLASLSHVSPLLGSDVEISVLSHFWFCQNNIQQCFWLILTRKSSPIPLQMYVSKLSISIVLPGPTGTSILRKAVVEHLWFNKDQHACASISSLHLSCIPTRVQTFFKLKINVNHEF